MRRRDATDDSIHHRQRRGRPAVVSVGLSLAVHVALLAATTSVILPGDRRTSLIRVALLSGGGGEGSVRVGKTVSEPVALPAPPVNPPQPKPERHRHNGRVAVVVSSRAPDRDAVVAVGADDGTAQDEDRQARGNGADAAGAGGVVGSGAEHAAGLGAGDGSDQRAYCVYCPQPHYPLVARARGWEGTVDVGLSVLPDGSVSGASLRHSSGYGALDAAAIAVARQSRFSPPTMHGWPAPLHGRIEYRFELTTSQ